MGVGTINLTNAIFSEAIQYKRLDVIYSKIFRNDKINTINIFIDLYPIMKSIRRPNYTEGNNVDICAGIINLAGHYRRYFLNRKIYSRIYLIDSNNIPMENIRLCPEYNMGMVGIVEGTMRKTNKLLDYNNDLLDRLVPYLSDIHVIHSTYETSVVMYDIIKKNQDVGDNTPNLIISRDIYPFQLTGLCRNTIQCRVKKHKGEDISYCVGFNTIYNALLYENKIDISKFNLQDIHPGLYSLVLSLNGFKKRKIKSIYNIRSVRNIVINAIDNGILLNNYNSIIDWSTIQQKESPDMMNKRYSCLDIPTQYSIYKNSFESNYSIMNLYDPDGLRSINEMYFKTLNPIVFDGLLME